MDFVRGVRERFPRLFSGRRVIEIGSLNINGSVRDFFNDCHYIGVDLADGPGVDLVCSGADVYFADGFFDVAISTECFEHNELWLQTFLNMRRMASEMVIFTCASEGRPEHGTVRSSPSDSPFTNTYYRNLTASDFEDSVDMAELFSVYEFRYQPTSHDLYFWGICK